MASDFGMRRERLERGPGLARAGGVEGSSAGDVQHSRWELVMGGAMAGLVAGVAMGLCAMAWSAADGLGAWLPARGVAALFFGVTALVDGWYVKLIGVIAHLVVAAVIGAIFALLLRNHARSAGSAFGVGLLYGIGVWLVMTFGFLPWADRLMFDRMNLMHGMWLCAHLLYGGVLCLTPAFVARVTRRRGLASSGKGPRLQRVA